MLDAVAVGLFTVVYNINEYYKEITLGFFVVGLIGLAIIFIVTSGITKPPQGKR